MIDHDLDQCYFGALDPEPRSLSSNKKKRIIEIPTLFSKTLIKHVVKKNIDITMIEFLYRKFSKLSSLYECNKSRFRIKLLYFLHVFDDIQCCRSKTDPDPFLRNTDQT